MRTTSRNLDAFPPLLSMPEVQDLGKTSSKIQASLRLVDSFKKMVMDLTCLWKKKDIHLKEC